MIHTTTLHSVIDSTPWIRTKTLDAYEACVLTIKLRCRNPPLWEGFNFQVFNRRILYSSGVCLKNTIAYNIFCFLIFHIFLYQLKNEILYTKDGLEPPTRDRLIAVLPIGTTLYIEWRRLDSNQRSITAGDLQSPPFAARDTPPYTRHYIFISYTNT